MAKLKRKKSTARKRIATIAIVCRTLDPEVTFPVVRSARDNGSWSAFMGWDRDEVIADAIKARAKWINNGLYDIYVGTLTEKIVTPTMFKAVRL